MLENAAVMFDRKHNFKNVPNTCTDAIEKEMLKLAIKNALWIQITRKTEHLDTFETSARKKED